MAPNSDLLNSVLTAHGGLEAYAKYETLTIKWHLAGNILRVKRGPGPVTATSTIATARPGVVPHVVHRGLTGDPDVEHVYTPTRVWSRPAADPEKVLEERTNPRDWFKGHQVTTLWDDLALTYFTGYAVWTYFNFPFLASTLLDSDDDDFRVSAEEVSASPKFPSSTVANANGDRILEVTFPDPKIVAAHTRRQQYYFDAETFALTRHDYTAEVVSEPFEGQKVAAHLCFDPVKVGGLVFPTLRRVVYADPRTGEPEHWAGTLMNIMIMKIEVGGEVWER